MLRPVILRKFHDFADSGHQGAFRQVWRCVGCVKISPLQLLLGAIFILRKGIGVGRWYSKILTISYRGR